MGNRGPKPPAAMEPAAMPGRTFRPLSSKLTSLPRLQADAIDSVLDGARVNTCEMNTDLSIKQKVIRSQMQHTETRCVDVFTRYHQYERQVLSAAVAFDQITKVNADVARLHGTIADLAEAINRIEYLLPAEAD